jgi:hypothetical protein
MCVKNEFNNFLNEQPNLNFLSFFETYFDLWLISLVETVTFLRQTLFKCQTSLLMQIYKKKIAYFQLNTSIIVGTAFLLLFLLSACYKKQDTILSVIVKNSNGQVLEGALVELKAEPTTFGNIVTIDMQKSTDELGVANFNFNDYYKSGQTGVVVLKIKAKHFGLSGEGVVTVEQEVVTETTVVLN